MKLSVISTSTLPMKMRSIGSFEKFFVFNIHFLVTKIEWVVNTVAIFFGKAERLPTYSYIS